jgi:regulator of replication initiation timing
MARTSAAADLQPIDRLEDKIRQLVAVVDTLRTERAKAVDDAARLGRELEAVRARLGESAGVSAEVATLREERDLIRARVSQMIAHIDHLNL